MRPDGFSPLCLRPHPGRFFAFQLAKLGRHWVSEANRKMPVASGDIREIVDKPVFVPLYTLFQVSCSKLAAQLPSPTPQSHHPLFSVAGQVENSGG